MRLWTLLSLIIGVVIGIALSVGIEQIKSSAKLPSGLRNPSAGQENSVIAYSDRFVLIKEVNTEMGSMQIVLWDAMNDQAISSCSMSQSNHDHIDSRWLYYSDGKDACTLFTDLAGNPQKIACTARQMGKDDHAETVFDSECNGTFDEVSIYDGKARDQYERRSSDWKWSRSK